MAFFTKLKNRTLAVFLFCLILLISLSESIAQSPGNQAEQDCIGAIPVCQDVYIQQNSYSGPGENPDEINPDNSCRLLPERNSVWYIFKIDTGGDLCFTITPNVPTDDYDWSVYDLTNRSCSEIFSNPSIEVACSWEAPDLGAGCTGETGPNGNITGPCGSQNTACIPVNPGETYVLLVDKFPLLDGGYTLDFSASTAVLFDDSAPSLVGAEPNCNGIEVSFSENILCNTVDPADFQLTGPGGPYQVTSVSSSNCETGGTFDRSFIVSTSPAVPSTGTYTISLVGNISDFCGNSATQASQDILLSPPPQAVIESDSAQCLSINEFQFTYPGITNVSRFQWDLGDGTRLSDENVSHSYTTSGLKTVRLIIADQDNCTDTTEKNIQVLPEASADFSLPFPPCEGDSSRFVNLSTVDSISNILRYTWNFGDGSTSNEQSPIHQYNDAGRVDIQLEVETDNGCIATTSQSLTVNAKPEVDFALDNAVCISDSATFADASFFDIQLPGASIPPSNLEWVFGDGSSVNGTANPSHNYSTGGIYDITLIATSNYGCTDSASKSLEVFEPFLPTNLTDTACIGSSINLRLDIPRDATAFWYQEEDDREPFHLGRSYGVPVLDSTQEFWVSVVSAEGCESRKGLVTARALPKGFGVIFVNDSIVELPLSLVNFSLRSDFSPVSYEWNFGDGETDPDPSPAHFYDKPGTYKVVLNTVDPNGCEYEYIKKIVVQKVVNTLIPTAFSPNGDGVNDALFMGHRLLSNFKIKIYDRFGKQIFESGDPDFQWDGNTTQGAEAPEGVYVYRLLALDITGIRIDQVGSITLIR